jgi:P27 family predicted phage terminase small subunit
MRLLQGNPGHRPINAPVVKPAAGSTCPEFLTGAAREEWDRIYPELERLGLICQIDRASLVSYCLAWKALVWAEAQLVVGGYLASGGNDTTVQHPAFIVMAKAMEKINRFASEFGFTPSARARVHFPGNGQSEDPDEKFFGAPGPRPVPPPPAPPKSRARRGASPA